MKIADKTDIKAGTISPEDRGDPAKERHSPFNPMRIIPGAPANALGAPGWVYGGFAIARSLEFSAREKGVQFMLNRHMDEIIREHAVLRPGDRRQGELHAAHESRNRRAAGKLLAATAISTSAPGRSTSARARP